MSVKLKLRRMKKSLSIAKLVAVVLGMMLVGGSILVSHHSFFSQIPVLAQYTGNSTAPTPKPCDSHLAHRSVCAGAGGRQVCTQDYWTCGEGDTGGPHNCSWVRGQCNYWGICKPRYCDTSVKCDSTCIENKQGTPGGTCNKPANGHQTNCLYTGHSSGKACVPAKAPDQPCWQDYCHYSDHWVCDATANNCVYTIANTNLQGSNSHLNK